MGGEPEGGVPRPRNAPHGPVPPARVLICDDHEVLRHGLRAVLRWAPDLVVVAEATDAEGALALAAELEPEITLVGLGTQGQAIPSLVRALTTTGTRVVLLGEAGSGEDMVEALRAGARGYVHTTVRPARLAAGGRGGGGLVAHARPPRRPGGGRAGGAEGRDPPRCRRHGRAAAPARRHPAGGRAGRPPPPPRPPAGGGGAAAPGHA